MDYVIGIDAGASRTRALALGRDGTALRSAEASGANFSATGDAETNVRIALRAVLGSEAPAAIALCAAGIGSDASFARAERFLKREAPEGCRMRIVAHDGRAALHAASPSGVGVALLAGTGAIAYGRDAGGREARASGWGYLVGDEGSLAWLGREALRAAARAADGRGERTALLPAILGELAVSDLRQALEPLMSEPHPAPTIVGAARALARAVADGDEVAWRIVATAADELARAAAAVARALSLVDVYLSGGAFAAVPALENATRERLAAVLPEARVAIAVDEPVRGAARLAAIAAWGEPV